MIQRPKGTADLYLSEMATWQYIEETARIFMHDYNYTEMRTPIFESKELFTRGVGNTTDIVTKEMYDFMDKGDRPLALKPEGTAPIVRAYVENKLFGPEFPKPLKVYYISPMFRYERPQGGRSRQFHQIGIEAIGSANPAIDVEGIALAWDFLKELGISDLKLVINTLGKSEDRVAYRTALIDYLTPFEEQLSEDSKKRLHANPLRVLDSKAKEDKEIVANAPSIFDHLSEEASTHFNQVKEMLDALEIPYTVDATMVRGLDYYQDTIFEIMADKQVFGAETTICGGGRYTGLVEELGGPNEPGFGFGMGMERLVLTLQKQEVEIPNLQELDVYVVGIGEETNVATLKIVQAIRQAGFSAERDYLNRKPKAQFRTASKMEAKVVITVGEDELANNVVQLKAMNTGKQVTVPMKDIESNFERVFNTNTTDMTAFNEFFNQPE